MRIFEKIKKNNIIILFFLTLICMTIGFATYNQILNVTGSVNLVPGGVIEIKSVTTVGLTNATADPQIINNNSGIDFNLSFTTVREENPTYEAIFEITISNQTFNDFVFNMPDYKLNVDQVTDDGIVRKDEYSAFAGWKISNANIGDKIPAKSEKIFRLTFTFSNPEDTYDVTYLIDSNFVPNVSKDDEATLMASVINSEAGDLTGNNTSAKFSVNVINTNSTDKTFIIEVKNTDKFYVQDGDTTEYTVPANDEGNYEFYLSRVDGTEFPYDSTNVDIEIVSDGTTYNAGSVTVLVDQTIVINDTTPPTISNVTATIGATEGTAQLTWDAKDNVTIDNYIIYVYKQNETDETVYDKVKEIDTQSADKTAEVTDLEDGTYYFTVCGVDNSGNTATEEEITNVTTEAGVASRCEDIELIWNFNVTINATNYLTYTGESTVKRGETYTATFSVSNTNYKIPESLTSVTMGGTEFSNYTYQNGTITIPDVTGDIVITASGIYNSVICLVEGTKILLADGSYKNIEDVEYTDLLAVYDHLNGGITQVYPVWIEKEGGITSSYQKITFDDGTYINVAGQHCLFDCEKNKYVDVSNDKEFNVGSKVYKIENEELKIVTAIKIEYINEEVRYYDVLSTTHYNVIANDLITTDIITQYCNILYEFKDKAVFKSFYKNEQLEYEKASFIPYNLFKGCNLNNTLSLVESNMVDMRSLGEFLLRREKEQITRNGERYYIVTTSKDEVNSNNINNYLYMENGIYTFPKIGAKYFVDTSTNKAYREGENFTVYNSTHFKVIY